jgi:hypothetical protein
MPTGAIAWSADSGSASDAGFVGAALGTATVTATSGPLTANATITVIAASIVATPVIDPPGGQIDGAVTVTLSSATVGADLRYTLDGSTPGAGSSLYAGPLTIGPKATTVNVCGFLAGRSPSAMASAAFTTPSSSSGGGSGGCGSIFGLLLGVLLLSARALHPRPRTPRLH